MCVGFHPASRPVAALPHGLGSLPSCGFKSHLPHSEPAWGPACGLGCSILFKGGHGPRSRSGAWPEGGEPHGAGSAHLAGGSRCGRVLKTHPESGWPVSPRGMEAGAQGTDGGGAHPAPAFRVSCESLSGPASETRFIRIISAWKENVPALIQSGSLSLGCSACRAGEPGRARPLVCRVRAPDPGVVCKGPPSGHNLT